jgi:hypothetical protein
LLLAFLALLFLLATAASETPYQALRLVGYSSDGVLSSLDGLSGLVGDAPERTTALILPVLSLLALLVLVAFAHFSSPFCKAIVVGVVFG